MKIYKYLIETPGTTHIMGHLTDIVSTGLDVNNNPCVWAVYDEKAPKKYFQINAVGTGWELDKYVNNNDKYLGIINDGEYIWHIIKSSGEKCHIMEEK